MTFQYARTDNLHIHQIQARRYKKEEANNKLINYTITLQTSWLKYFKAFYSIFV